MAACFCGLTIGGATANAKRIGRLSNRIGELFAIEIRTRCVTQPTDHQEILLDRLGLTLGG